MARTTLAVQTVSVAGISPTFTAPNGTGTGNGNTFAASNTAIPVLIVKNADTASHTVTIPGNGVKVKGVAIPDHVRVVAAGATALIWLPPDYYATGGLIAADIEAVTGVTWAAVKFPTAFA